MVGFFDSGKAALEAVGEAVEMRATLRVTAPRSM